MHAPRGLAIQLRDKGSIMGVQFTNVSLETQFIEGDEGGLAEPLYVTALPRNMQTRVRLCIWHATAAACTTSNGLHGAWRALDGAVSDMAEAGGVRCRP